MLAGANSSGKSSLTQSLLLLKQTLESGSKEPLKLDGQYVSADNLAELLYGKQRNSLLSYEFFFEAQELADVPELESYIHDDKLVKAKFSVSFVANGSIHVSDASLTLTGTQKDVSIGIKRISSGTNIGKCQVVASEPKILGLDETNGVKKLTPCSLEFSNFIPTFGECLRKNAGVKLFTFPLLKVFRKSLEQFFSDMIYIGPIRIKPELIVSYNTTPQSSYVEQDGLNTRYILHEKKSMKLSWGATLGEEIQEWVCNRLGLAENIETSKDQAKHYRTKLQNKQGLAIDLSHMGFGVSQVLPIIVQALMMKRNSLLIVEDPCVHMHPYIQAELVDFFLEVGRKTSCKILLETHSDHMITRLRRRVAEGFPTKEINLTYVEQTEHGSLYKKISMTPSGAFDGVLPKKFLNVQDEDFRAMLKARMNHD